MFQKTAIKLLKKEKMNDFINYFLFQMLNINKNYQ